MKEKDIIQQKKDKREREEQCGLLIKKEKDEEVRAGKRFPHSITKEQWVAGWLFPVAGCGVKQQFWLQLETLRGMGCGSSKLEDLPAVALCRERCGFLDEAIHQRYALAAAHMAYINSLKAIGHSLHLFIQQDMDAPPSPSPSPSPSPPHKYPYCLFLTKTSTSQFLFTMCKHRNKDCLPLLPSHL